MEICQICQQPIKECPMLNGEMDMSGAPKFIKGIPNRKEIKLKNINDY